MAKNQTIYTIKVLRWEEYNPKHKPGHPRMQLPNNFVWKPEVAALSNCAFRLYCTWLLMCNCDSSSTIVGTKFTLSSSKVSPKLFESSIRELLQNQLVTVEKSDALINKYINKYSSKGPDGIDNGSRLEIVPETTIPKKLKDSDCRKFETRFSPLFQTIKNWSEENNFKFKDSVVAKLVLEYKSEESFSSWLKQFQASPNFKKKSSDEQLRMLAGTLVKIANGDE